MDAKRRARRREHNMKQMPPQMEDKQPHTFLLQSRTVTRCSKWLWWSRDSEPVVSGVSWPFCTSVSLWRTENLPQNLSMSWPNQGNIFYSYSTVCMYRICIRCAVWVGKLFLGFALLLFTRNHKVKHQFCSQCPAKDVQKVLKHHHVVIDKFVLKS